MAEPHRIEGASFGMDRNGVITFKIPWIVSSVEELATFTPNDAPLGLPIALREAREDNGDWQLILTYEGVREGAEIEETYELDASTSEDPIETHPDWEALKKKYKALMDGDKLEGWTPTIQIAGETRKNPMLGVSAYLSISAVWRRTFGVRSFPEALLKELGCVDTPRGRVSPPGLPEGRNWLKRSLKATWRGNIWTCTEEHLASGRGGWNRDIYRVR